MEFNKCTFFPSQDRTGLSAISTEYADGEVRCFFDRDQVVLSNAANFLDLSAGNSYDVILAFGHASGGGNFTYRAVTL